MKMKIKEEIIRKKKWFGRINDLSQRENENEEKKLRRKWFERGNDSEQMKMKTKTKEEMIRKEKMIQNMPQLLYLQEESTCRRKE